MENYTKEISMGTADKLSMMLEEDYDFYEGTLLDNFIFYNSKKITVDGVEPRDFIIVREFYKSPWSSGLEMIMTNDEDLVDYYRNLWESEEEEF